jgi:hypothetical protein
MKPTVPDVVRSGPGSRGRRWIETRALAPLGLVALPCLPLAPGPAQNRQPRAKYECQHPPPAGVRPAARATKSGRVGTPRPGDVSTTMIYSHVLNRAVAA